MITEPKIDPTALRAEHDALAARLATRPSVDVLRRAAIHSFLGLVLSCLSWGLVWDRFGKTPTAFALAHTEFFRIGWIATALGAMGFFTSAVVRYLRSRDMAREEQRLFLRLRELRRVLGIDP